MKRLEVAPRSADWHAMRMETWTASTAAVLVARENAELLRDYAATKGVTLDIAPLLAVGIESFFGNTLWTTWAQKNGRIPRFQGNAHTERGQENEERVLAKFEMDQLIMAEREVTAIAAEHPWLLASFDAVAPASSDPSVVAPYGFPVEAKCPAFQSRKKLWDAKKAGMLAIRGLPYYWCQVQHQIAVAEAPYGWFVAAGVEKDKVTGVEEVVFPIVEKIPRDDDFLKAYLAAAKFYHDEFIDACEEPPKLKADEDLIASLVEKATFDRAIAESNPELAVDLYFDALRAEEAAVARRKELEEKVKKAAAGMRAAGEDVVLLADRLEVTFVTATTVSWQKVAKQLAKDAGLSDIPPDVLAKCESSRESVKLKEVA